MKKAIIIPVALFTACIVAIVFALIWNSAKLLAKESSQRALIAEAQIIHEDHSKTEPNKALQRKTMAALFAIEPTRLVVSEL